MKLINEKGLHEPSLQDKGTFFGSLVVNNLDQFKAESKVIVVNRIDDGLSDVMSKVYSRDLFGRG